MPHILVPQNTEEAVCGKRRSADEGILGILRQVGCCYGPEGGRKGSRSQGKQFLSWSGVGTARWCPALRPAVPIVLPAPSSGTPLNTCIPNLLSWPRGSEAVTCPLGHELDTITHEALSTRALGLRPAFHVDQQPFLRFLGSKQPTLSCCLPCPALRGTANVKWPREAFPDPAVRGWSVTV